MNLIAYASNLHANKTNVKENTKPPAKDLYVAYYVAPLTAQSCKQITSVLQV
jgi:hypothetical protein